MAVDTLLLRRINQTVDAERKFGTRTYLSYYMPFVGVRYYAIFDNDNVTEGERRIGPVGWRLDEPEIKMRTPVAA